jgi:saccharopine dehydrogenase-like NADP-dependent oxidoreductase
MKILTAGCGHIGSVLVKDLLSSTSYDITISDINLIQAHQIRNSVDANLKCVALDVTDHNTAVSILQEYDIVIGLTPGNIGYRLLQAAIQAKTHCIDLSFMPENPLTLASAAQKAKICVIPDCGVAPGLSNILVGHGATMFDHISNIQIYVGGNPAHPIPPLDYILTWSLEDLLEEYLRKVTIVKDQHRIKVDALEGLELFPVPNMGTLEAFYTDGLRTLLDSFPTVTNMWEKTLRYPGHREKIKLLKDLGFLSNTPITINGKPIIPRSVTQHLLRKVLTRPGVQDILTMHVNMQGHRGPQHQQYSCYLQTQYDVHQGLTAMAQTTAYTASIVVQLLANGDIQFRGVMPPERLGMLEPIFQKITTELKERHINLNTDMKNNICGVYTRGN